MNKPVLIALAFSMTLGVCAALAQRPPTPPPGTPPPRLPTGAVCMADNPASAPLVAFGYGGTPNISNRALNGAVNWSSVQTNALCRANCRSRGFTFSGTQAHGYCFCGNSMGSFGATNRCTDRCMGRGGVEACGGRFANTVMQTGAVPTGGPPGFSLPAGIPPFGTQTPHAPAGGAQCVIDIAGFSYRYFEVDTWSPNGAPTTASGVTTIPLTWTLSGGAYRDGLTISTAPNGQVHSTEDVRTWTFDNNAPTGSNGSLGVQSFSWTVRSNAGVLIFSSAASQGVGGNHEVQRHAVDGAFDAPGPPIPTGIQVEFPVTGSAASWSAGLPHTFTQAINDSHHPQLVGGWQPGSTGAINCVLNVP